MSWHCRMARSFDSNARLLKQESAKCYKNGSTKKKSTHSSMNENKQNISLASKSK